MSEPKVIYLVELEAIPGHWLGAPHERLKALLKRALRTHGLRCNSVSTQKPIEVKGQAALGGGGGPSGHDSYGSARRPG